MTLTPRNVEESKAVMQILTTFKKAAAAKRSSGSNGFLKTPDVFRITYKKGIDNQKYLNKFKVCALTQVGVNYTGSGIHATYEDGTPVHYKLDLAFTELEPIYAEDYGDNYDEAGFLMSNVSYFNFLPNFQYINPVQTGGKKKQYVEVKNLFMRMKIKDSIIDNATNFRKYDIQEGQRPDNVALELYGDGNYDWVVLLTANIINARDEWLFY